MALRSSRMSSTSTIPGTLESVYSPSARMAAAISFSTEFLAPPTVTVPARGPAGRTVIEPIPSVCSAGCPGWRHAGRAWRRTRGCSSRAPTSSAKSRPRQGRSSRMWGRSAGTSAPSRPTVTARSPRPRRTTWTSRGSGGCSLCPPGAPSRAHRPTVLPAAASPGGRRRSGWTRAPRTSSGCWPRPRSSPATATPFSARPSRSRRTSSVPARARRVSPARSCGSASSSPSSSWRWPIGSAGAGYWSVRRWWRRSSPRSERWPRRWSCSPPSRRWPGRWPSHSGWSSPSWPPRRCRRAAGPMPSASWVWPTPSAPAPRCGRCPWPTSGRRAGGWSTRSGSSTWWWRPAWPGGCRRVAGTNSPTPNARRCPPADSCSSPPPPSSTTS